MISAKRFFYQIQITALLFLQSACGGLSFVEPVLADSHTSKNTNPAANSVFTRLADCADFINESPQRVSCGFIDLPVNHDEPTKSKVSLPILIAEQTRSLTPGPGQQAILIPGGGGPGGSIGFGLSYQADEYLGIYHSLRAAGFDLIIMDQRGAGFSKPVLNCPETAVAFKNSIDAKESFIESLQTYRVSLKACRARLESKNISLPDFDTYQSARDFLAVIDRLPYQWWGVLATSYATVIAQEMALLMPSIFNRIVLDSPVAIDYQKPFTFELTISSLERILFQCETDHRCNKKYNNISKRFRDVVARFKQQPLSLEIEIYESQSGEQQPNLQVDDSTLLDMLILTSYSNYGIAEIPAIIDGLHRGRTGRLKNLATEYWHYNSDLDFASALSWTIHCKERQPMEEAYLRRRPESYNSYSDISKIAFDQERLICSDWGKQSNSKITTNQLINTETLIVAGDLDPVIDRDDISNTADNFTNKQVMILPGTGHSVWFQSACTRQNVATFFSNHNTNPALHECNDGLSRFK